MARDSKDLFDLAEEAYMWMSSDAVCDYIITHLVEEYRNDDELYKRDYRLMKG